MEWHSRFIRLCKWLHSTGFGVESILNRIGELFVFECVCSHRWMFCTEFKGQITRSCLHLRRAICFWHSTTLCARLFHRSKCHRCKLLFKFPGILVIIFVSQSRERVFRKKIVQKIACFRWHLTIAWAHSGFCHWIYQSIPETWVWRIKCLLWDGSMRTSNTLAVIKIESPLWVIVQVTFELMI